MIFAFSPVIFAFSANELIRDILVQGKEGKSILGTDDTFSLVKE
jgi:hypothetical protein